jgi:hypothetical protein
MKKKLLIICATHGNEKIGLEAMAELRRKNLSDYFDCIVANAEALKKNIRFVDCDLNRCYPGDKASTLYEKRRAAEILEIAKDYEYVIDMHEVSSGTEDFIIIAKDRMCQTFPVELVNMHTVLLWPDPKGPLGEILENEIELEFGVKGRDREEVIAKAVEVLEEFIGKIYSEETKQWPSSKEIYQVYGKLMIDDFKKDINPLKDFVETEVGEERFYPLLVGQYLEDGIVCYKMRLLEK